MIKLSYGGEKGKGVGGKCRRGRIDKSGISMQQINHPPYHK